MYDYRTEYGELFSVVAPTLKECLIIADDVGAVVTKEKLTIMLEEQLPISEPHVGLSYPMDY